VRVEEEHWAIPKQDWDNNRQATRILFVIPGDPGLERIQMDAAEGAVYIPTMGSRPHVAVASALLLLPLAGCAGDDGTMATTAAPIEAVETAAPDSTSSTTPPTSTTTTEATPIIESTDQPDVGEHRPALTDQLVVLPVEGGVYLLGNSMFATGVDLEAMQTEVPERDVSFNYYDGHYTSLWYLIAETALGPAEERPELIVWGFRPRYAMIPAFRQNRPNSTDLFEFSDPEYERLTGEAVESGDFLTGPNVEFADGFIPLTADSFRKSALPQLVVIWRPVTVAQGTPDPNEERFVEDAIAYFDAEGISYVDFFHDDVLSEAMYGKGDHYNADGMAHVTDKLVERIREMLKL